MRGLSRLLLIAGPLLLSLGLASPIIHFLLSHPWARLAVLGATLTLAGGILALLEDGCAAALPPALRQCFFESPFEIGLHLRMAARNLKLPTPIRQGDARLSQLARVAALCCLDLDDELVEAVVASLEDDFREAAFQPCARSLNPTLQRLVLGREGVARLDQMQEARSSQVDLARSGSLSPSEMSAASLHRRRTTKTIAREIHQIRHSEHAAARSSQAIARRRTEAPARDSVDKRKSRASESSQTRRDLSLVWRILCGHFMVPALRRAEACVRASTVWCCVVWIWSRFVHSWVGAMLAMLWPRMRQSTAKVAGGA